MAFSRREIHIDKPLSEFALSYLQDNNNFIANKVLPPLPTQKESDKYFVFDRNSWRVRDDLRAPKSVSNETNMPALSTDTFLIEEHALHTLVSQREIDNADTPLRPEQDATAEVIEQLLIAQESSCANILFLTSSATNYTSLATASKWDYTSTTTPIATMRVGINTISKEIGRKANTAVMGQQVFNKLQDHADFLDRIKYTEKGVVTEDLIASVLNLDNVYVGGASNVTTGEGVSETTAYIWGLNVLLSYVNPRPNPKGVSHGYTFTKSASQNGQVIVKKWWEEKRNSYWIEGSLFYDQKIVSPLAAYIIFGATAS